MYSVVEATPEDIGLVYIVFIGAAILAHGIIRAIITAVRGRRDW